VTRGLRYLLIGLVLGFGPAATAQAPTEAQVSAAQAELIQAADDGTLALMGLVARHGDTIALTALGEDVAPELKLAAIRACPALEAPEACLEPLIRELSGRDPDLAPAAALALFECTRGLSADALARREASTAPLLHAASALESAVEDSHLRPDLARLANLGAAALRAATQDGGPERP